MGINDVRKIFNVEIGDIIRVTNSMYPEITYGNKENLTISEDQYENWLHNEGVNRHGCHSYKGQVVHRSVKDNGRIRSGEELKKKENDKINQMEEIVYLPGLRHIYTKVEPSDKPRKPTIILHSTFATELKSTLINTDPKNFCDGYLPKTTHYPVFVEKVRDTILPDNAQINRLTLEEDVINLIVFAKDQQFLKHIGKKYQKSIGESITLKYEKKQSVQSFEGLRSEVIRELKLINTGFKENDAISKIQINDEIRKRLIQSLTGKGQTEVVDLDIYNLLNVNIFSILQEIVQRNVSQSNWLEVRWKPFML